MINAAYARLLSPESDDDLSDVDVEDVFGDDDLFDEIFMDGLNFNPFLFMCVLCVWGGAVLCCAVRASTSNSFLFMCERGSACGFAGSSSSGAKLINLTCFFAVFHSLPRCPPPLPPLQVLPAVWRQRRARALAPRHLPLPLWPHGLCAVQQVKDVCACRCVTARRASCFFD